MIGGIPVPLRLPGIGVEAEHVGVGLGVEIGQARIGNLRAPIIMVKNSVGPIGLDRIEPVDQIRAHAAGVE